MFGQYREMGSGKKEKIFYKVWLVLLLISTFGATGYAAYFAIIMSWEVPGAFEVKTLPATNIDTNSVTLNGNVTKFNVSSATIWFEYGRNENNYIFRTANQTITQKANFSQDVEGIQLMPDTTYHFRACGSGSNSTYGSDMNFTTSSLSPFETKNFSKNYEELEASKFNISKLATVLPKTYTNMMPSGADRIFYGLFFGLIFMAIWMRHEDITIPALLGMTIGASIWVFLPIGWMKLAQSLFIVSFACMIYALIKGRK